MSAKLCFVVMPFGDERADPEKHLLWTELYAHLKQVVEDTGLSCVRADEVRRPGNIIRDIIRHLAGADIVIAEMTDRNPNVFYELGVRHALSSRTILLTQRTEDVPFDLRPYRHIVYRFTPRGAAELATQLKAHIAEVLKEPPELDSPVREYLTTVSPRQEQALVGETGATTALERELEKLKSQNYKLAADLREVMSVVGGLSSGRHATPHLDLGGTWKEIAFPSHSEAFIAEMKGLLVIAYEGTWPGCCWGTVQDGIYRFAWSRFDYTLSGNGYYRISESLDRLDGGIWFDDTDVEVMLTRGSVLEKHAMIKTSVAISDSGHQVLRRAQLLLIKRKVLRDA